MNKIDKRRKRKDTVTNIRNKKGDINTDAAAIGNIKREYYENYPHKFNNLEESTCSLESHKLPKYTQNEIDNPNKSYVC